MFLSALDLPMDALDRIDPSRWLALPNHMKAALDGLTTGLLTFDKNLDVLFSNARLAEVLNITPAILEGPVCLPTLLESSALVSDAVQFAHEACLIAVNIGSYAVEPPLLLHSGPRCFTQQIIRLHDGNWLMSFEEVTDRRAAEANALEQAMRDPLTDLPNRQLLQKRTAASLAELAASGVNDSGTGHAIMLVDLDRFKAVNDTLGHPVGDGLLRLVAKRLRSVSRQADVVARLGGDEFALLISPAPDPDHLGRLANRVVDMIGRPYLVDGHLINIGASVGIAVSPQDGQTHDQLMRSADLALYASKKAGRSTWTFFEPAMDACALARRSLEVDLRKALPLREFELHYQPQIDLERNAVVGFEALVRWRHPERGLVSPADFIPLAEEIGMIVPLGEWVVQEACREAMRWPSDISVAVNVSPHQFANTARLLHVIAQALAVSGLPGSRLEIEITESVLLRNEEVVLSALHRLRAMQVRVAMDDFGTGYSSLSQLHSFPFDKIKIDRSFVKDRGDVQGQNAIIRAITALGVSLGMSTIAEGVETPGQLDRIRAEGCTSVQGYLFSRPVPVEQIDDLLATFADGRASGDRSPASDPERTCSP